MQVRTVSNPSEWPKEAERIRHKQEKHAQMLALQVSYQAFCSKGLHVAFAWLSCCMLQFLHSVRHKLRTHEVKPLLHLHCVCALQRGQEKEPTEGVATEDAEPLPPYEQQRKENIARNERMLSQIQRGLKPGPQGISQPLRPHKVPRKEQDRPGSKGTQSPRQGLQEPGDDGQGRGAVIARSAPCSADPTAGQGRSALPKSSARKRASTESNALPQAPTQSASAPVGDAVQAHAEDGPSPADASVRHTDSQDIRPGPGSREHATAAMERKIQPHRSCKKLGHGRPVKHADVQGGDAAASTGVKQGKQHDGPHGPGPPPMEPPPKEPRSSCLLQTLGASEDCS